MDILEYMASSPLFQGLPRENLKDLATLVVDQVYRRGQLIFSEGDDGIGFYVIISGRAKIFKLSLGGKEQILHIFGPGEPIGEVGPNMRGERIAWAISHNCYEDPICQANCLDVCVDHNNKCAAYQRKYHEVR